MIWQAIRELGIRETGKTRRTQLLGPRAKEITKEFSKRTGMTRDNCKNILDYWLEENTANLLKDPSTFDTGIQLIMSRPRKKNFPEKTSEDEFDVTQFLSDDVDSFGTNLQPDCFKTTSTDGHQSQADSSVKQARGKSKREPSLVKKLLGNRAGEITSRIKEFHKMPKNEVAWKKLNFCLNSELAGYLLNDDTFDKGAGMIIYTPTIRRKKNP